MLQKIRRRLFQKFIRFFPYRSSFRPSSVFVPSAYGETRYLKYHRVLKEYETTLTYPADLYKWMLKKNYDAVAQEGNPVLTASKTDAFVLEIEKGRLLTDNRLNISVIDQQHQLIDKVSYQYLKGKTVTVEENEVLKQKFFYKPEHIKGNVFVMLSGGGASEGNYYHWMIDTLPRIHLLKLSGFFEKIDFFVVPQYAYPFQKETLQILGIGKEKIIVPAKHQFHVTADRLFVSSHPRGEKSFLIPDWVFDFYKNHFSHGEVSSTAIQAPYVYISRADSPKRKVSNEEEILPFLREAGFQVFQLSKLGFQEQICLFAQAKIILSSHGAGLVNMVFCKNKSVKLIEFYSEGFVHAYFYDVAFKMGIEYHFLIFKNKNPANDERKGQWEDVYVDLDALKTMLQRIS